MTISNHSDHHADEIADRQKRLTQRLADSTDRLKLARQQLAECEEHGIDTLNLLYQQREQMLQVKDNLAQADANIDQANGLLQTMSRRQFWIRVLSLGML